MSEKLPALGRIPKLSESRALDKENGLNLSISGSLGKSKGHLKAQNGSRKQSASPLTRMSSPSLGPSRRQSFLRFGETMETVFGLNQSSSEEQRKLCRQIVNGTLADDAPTWNRVLSTASNTLSGKSKDANINSLTTIISNTLLGSDMVRLYRRATSRFNSLPGRDNAQPMFQLWIAFARAQMKQGSYRDARHSLIHIQNLKLGEKEAAFYLTFADLEFRQQNIEAALSLIQKGMNEKAEPLHALEQAYTSYKESVEPTNTSQKRKLRHQLEPTSLKHQKPLPEPFEESFESEGQCGTDNSNMSIGTIDGVSTTSESRDSIKFQLAPAPDRPITVSRSEKVSVDGVPKDDKLSLPSHVPLDSVRKTPLEKTNAPSAAKDVKSESKLVRAPLKSVSFTPRQTAALTGKARGPPKSVGTLRPPLLAKAQRFARVDLGKAKRVDPTMPCAIDSDTDDDNDDTTSNVPAEVSRSEQPSKNVTQMDLTYIYQWDPDQYRKKATRKDERLNDKLPNKSSPLKKVIETPSTNASGGSRVSTSFSNHSDRSQDSSTRGSTRVEKGGATTDMGHHGAKQTAVSAKKSTSTTNSGSNPDFLPLVDENNMLRVNEVPYAKLGVIGKGGSCKVYRALAKDCSVYAIKKVKIGGMDKKAIEGYSNEISLLQRLRGNPAIIQLYDSQVDLKRKAIFLVMEVGEVDLNHVLRMHTIEKEDSSNGPRNLNMNFIRLTWQQMLSAVHCIHEERIIHGDLKPANFLFVRGTLKLIDFGIAKAIQSDDTTNIYRENQIGTLNYMSPEAILSSEDGIKIGRVSTFPFVCILPLLCSYLYLLYSGFGYLVVGLYPVSDDSWQDPVCRTPHDTKIAGNCKSKSSDPVSG